MGGRGVTANDDRIRAMVPAGERGTIEDVAAAVCYPASNEARYVNGPDLAADGGWRAKSVRGVRGALIRRAAGPAAGGADHR